MNQVWHKNRNNLWESRIGFPYLSLKGIKCLNISCGKENRFKKYFNNIYICECGYFIEGEYEIVLKESPKLFCKVNGASCPQEKSKMDRNCLSCHYIGEK